MEQTGQRMLGIAMADASPLFRRGVQAVVEATTDLRWCGGVGSVSAALDLADGAGVDDGDVLLWDAALDDSDASGLLALRARRPKIVVLVLTRRSADVATALRAGAAGVVDRSVSETGMAEALRDAGAGRTVMASGAGGPLWDQVVSTVRGGGPMLTRRERQVLELMGRGLGNRAIAEELFISENTVKNHVRRVHEKLQVHSRTEAVVRAAQEGIVEIA